MKFKIDRKLEEKIDILYKKAKGIYIPTPKKWEKFNHKVMLKYLDQLYNKNWEIN